MAIISKFLQETSVLECYSITVTVKSAHLTLWSSGRNQSTNSWLKYVHKLGKFAGFELKSNTSYLSKKCQAS